MRGFVLAPRLAMAVATVIVFGAATYTVVDAVRGWNLSDMEAYWNAALRLRQGGPLYIHSYSTGAHDLYLYSPWFAYVWIPLTYLPRAAVSAAWACLLLGATVLSVRPAFQRQGWGGVLLGLLVGSLLFWTASKGNVQALLTCVLVYGARGRFGPLSIAVAASLKAAPLALVAIYLGRREWRRAAVTIGLTAILVIPILFFDFSTYPSNPGVSTAIFYTIGPGAWLAAALAAFAMAWRLARTRWGWLAAAVAVIAAFPRLLTYDLSLLLVGLPPSAGGERFGDQWRPHPNNDARGSVEASHPE